MSPGERAFIAERTIPPMRRRLRIRVRGAVQGVGFRPFVDRLAARCGLAGFVVNDGDGVRIEVEGGDEQALDAFIRALHDEHPPLARIDDLDITPISTGNDGRFEIRDSITGTSRTRIVPDVATCDDCLRDMFDPASRFHLYPFVTCTNCGPRFTITRQLPYDRARTSMAAFPLCEACVMDYGDRAGRRFHAESIACPACGPHLSHPVTAIAAAITAGRIVALKGIGGFHLICDARNEAAAARLRLRKERGDKPFAIMVANAASLDRVARPSALERALVTRGDAPIVLMRRRRNLAPAVAPGLATVGVMLPYAPVHHLIFHALAGMPAGEDWRREPQQAALVVTSANAGGEPLVAGGDDAPQLASLADLVVTHDRAIVARADDSVMAVIDRAPCYLRRSRGAVPEPIDLGEDGPSVLGLGAHLKTTVTVTRGREAFVSQHVGDLDNAATIRFHADVVRHLLDILDVKPEAVSCDLHPDFHSTRYADSSGLPVIAVQHHAGHIAAVAAEHHVHEPILGVALDGYGFGNNGEAWGGELLAMNGAAWHRLGHLRPIPLLGGDRVARESWRMGVAVLAALGRVDAVSGLFSEIPLAVPLARALAGSTRMPVTTSMGRLFDAAAALLGSRVHQSYEGQAAMELQALVGTPKPLPGGFRLAGNVLDFLPLFEALLPLRGDLRGGAELLHGTLIEGLARWITAAASRSGRKTVALGGGCFMNGVLAEGVAGALRATGLVPLLPRAVPANDGGLSLGQAHLARLTLARGARPLIGGNRACA